MATRGKTAEKSASTKKKLDIQPIVKPESKQGPTPKRWFLVDFHIRFTRNDGTTGMISDTAGLGKLDAYPSKIGLAQSLPGAYGISEENAKDIVVYGIHPWTLSEQDYLDYTKT